MAALDKALEYLRREGMSEKTARALANGETVREASGDSFLSWIRHAYRSGREDARDPYVWHDVGDLIRHAPRPDWEDE